MIKTFLTTIFLISSFSFAKATTVANCDLNFKKENICATLTWIKRPVVVAAPTAKDAATFDLKFWNAKTLAKLELGKNQSLFVSLYMPSMGHGSEPVILKKDEHEQGLYHVTQVLFSMEGAWEIRARIQKSDKVVDSAALPFNFK
ncbi:MAG TPA: FixH family protein [Bdellovibrio sp.]|nr:FixH family protein [Bdellovibrio sp.]